MPLLESIIFKEPLRKQFLIINFEDGDEIYSCIKESMLEHSLKKCVVENCSGRIKNATINCFSGNCFKKIDFCIKEISNVSGEFKLSQNELFGNMKISTSERKPLQGTLVKGFSQDFVLKLSFIK